MIPIRGLTVCRTHPEDKVRQPKKLHYDDLLAITLPRNMRHLIECVVVTSPDDERTKAVCAAIPGVRAFETDAFTRPDSNGVVPFFNKGRAIEEAFDFMGRHGWILVWDADILFPGSLRLDTVVPGYLWGAQRRMLDDPRKWTPEFNWALAPLGRDLLIPGYFQLFHADDIQIANKRPWYDPTFTHAGGGDAYFSELWPPSLHKRILSTVLHLGRKDTNWFGTSEDGRKTMDAYLVRKGWTHTRKDIDHRAAREVGPVAERLSIDGHHSNYTMPAERNRRHP